MSPCGRGNGNRLRDFYAGTVTLSTSNTLRGEASVIPCEGGSRLAIFGGGERGHRSEDRREPHPAPVAPPDPARLRRRPPRRTVGFSRPRRRTGARPDRGRPRPPTRRG